MNNRSPEHGSNGNYTHDPERVELGQGVWYSRETGYVMLDITHKIPSLGALQVHDETLYPKDEYHVSIINTRRYVDELEQEEVVVAAIRDHLASHKLGEVEISDENIYLSQYGDSVTVLATVAETTGLCEVQTMLTEIVPGYEQLLHVTLLRNNPPNRGTAVPSQAFLEENAVKLSSFGIELSEREEEMRPMAYGSERFASVTANNHNRVYRADTDHVTKLVLGKDVVCVLPRDPNKLDIHAGYPTHQESWLPMWFVMLNYSQAQCSDDKEFISAIRERVTQDDADRMQKALIYKALEFWQAYQNDTQTEPKKRYKNLTRILQDILLYVDQPISDIDDQQSYLEAHQLYPLVQRANELRRGIRLEEASEFEQIVEAIIRSYSDQFVVDELETAYTELQAEIAQRDSGEVFVLPEASIDDAESYINRITYDLVMADDAHDKDVVSVIDGLRSPQFHQMVAKTGPGLENERRIDIITVPPNLGVWDVAEGGKESYQPISMILATHTTPSTDLGRELQERIQSELDVAMTAHHYLGAAEEFLHRDAWGKSFAQRQGRADIPQIKKVIPLYRVACDLLPRAVYMLKTGKFPAGVSNEELFKVGEVEQITRTIEQLFEKQDATEQELVETYRQINDVFSRWFSSGDHDIFVANMQLMRQGEVSHFQTGDVRGGDE